MFRSKRTGLQLDNHISSQMQMVEEQIYVEVFSSNFEVHLPTDIGEPCTELKEEVSDVADQGCFDLSLLGFVAKTRKSSRYGSLSDSRARSESGFGNTRSKFVVARPWRSIRLRSICITSTLRDQPNWRTASAYASRRSGSFSFVRSTMLWPQGNCPTGCWTIALGPCVSESTHIHQVGARESAEIRERLPQIVGKSLDNLYTPGLSCLAIKNLPSNMPVKG